MLHFLIQRPIAVITSLLALLALSVFMLRKIPVGLLPDIPIPRITVQVSLPGVGAADIERQVLQPIRNQLLQVGGLADIESVAEDGLGLVALEFDYGRNTDLAFIEVNEKIDQVIPRLPRNMERPRVIKANVSDLPVFYLSVVERQDTLQQI
ncbi:MAG: efflux RND transporter permease subunit, partial [Saprospiraceae bacterium]|nr:efflux RND transporter permease subunit [Saprospiraceae bacterium]